MQNLFDLATTLGVRVEYADLRHLGRDGDYDAQSRAIRLQPGMLYRLERSVLAHELAHAVHGDRLTMFRKYDARAERRADEWAAHVLIDMTDYRIAEEKFATNIEYIARELCVMDWIVVAYERTLHRIGDTVYVSPKMGAGQWARKVSA